MREEVSGYKASDCESRSKTPGRASRDNAQTKWCSGPCGRELPITEYDLKPGGYRQSSCRACRRVYTRDRLRLRYRKSARFRQRIKTRARRRYWANPEAKRASVAARKARLGA